MAIGTFDPYPIPHVSKEVCLLIPHINYRIPKKKREELYPFLPKEFHITNNLSQTFIPTLT